MNGDQLGEFVCEYLGLKGYWTNSTAVTSLLHYFCTGGYPIYIFILPHIEWWRYVRFSYWFVSVLFQVYSLLEKATHNRAVAATQCNERSSRSHSVFRLKLVGENHLTGEKCQGMQRWVSLDFAPPPNGRQGERESFFQATHWFGHPILIKTRSSTLTRQ